MLESKLEPRTRRYSLCADTTHSRLCAFRISWSVWTHDGDGGCRGALARGRAPPPGAAPCSGCTPADCSRTLWYLRLLHRGESLAFWSNWNQQNIYIPSCEYNSKNQNHQLKKSETIYFYFLPDNKLLYCHLFVNIKTNAITYKSYIKNNFRYVKIDTRNRGGMERHSRSNHLGAIPGLVMESSHGLQPVRRCARTKACRSKIISTSRWLSSAMDLQEKRTAKPSGADESVCEYKKTPGITQLNRIAKWQEFLANLWHFQSVFVYFGWLNVEKRWRKGEIYRVRWRRSQSAIRKVQKNYRRNSVEGEVIFCDQGECASFRTVRFSIVAHEKSTVLYANRAFDI